VVRQWKKDTDWTFSGQVRRVNGKHLDYPSVQLANLGGTLKVTQRRAFHAYEPTNPSFVVIPVVRGARHVTQVFLNYRRTDEPFGVTMLDQRLSERFGSEAVFLASKSIALGARWDPEMFEAVRRSTALLAIIGRNWLADTDTTGRRRIDDPADYVRREILLAMELGKIVIPVRLDTPRTAPADLPEKLRPLLERQDIELRFRTAGVDLDHLETRLRRLIPGLPERRKNRSGTYNDQASHYEFHDLVVDTFHAGPSFHGPQGA
jgi:hypothetical protein